MKKQYMKPTMQMVELRHKCHIMVVSNHGVNRSLQSEGVDDAWTKENRGSWGDDW